MEHYTDEFRNAIAAAGLPPPAEIIADGKIHRFSTNRKVSDDAGWYALHDDSVPSGVFGDWRTDFEQTWCAKAPDGSGRNRSAEHRQIIEASRRQRAAEHAARRDAARQSAAKIWSNAVPATDVHPYLQAKQVRSYGLREADGNLIVPVTDGTMVHSLQTISPDGEKGFLEGGRVKGGYYMIGAPRTVLCIAEGYATAASVHEGTGYAVAVAFNAGNLVPVVQEVRRRFPGLKLVVCADDDASTTGNPGLTKARLASATVQGHLAVPSFVGVRNPGLTDFNDLHRHVGSDAVRACIEHAVAQEPVPDIVNWPAPRPITASLKPVPSFDPETLLPDPLRVWIMDEADRMPCPPDFIAVAVLVAMGSLIGSKCAIRPKSQDAWLVVPNLWGGIVGDPSAKKSPAWGVALKPLDRLITQARERYESEEADYAMANIVYKAQHDAIEGRIKEAAKKPAKGDPHRIGQELRAHANEEPEEPTLRRFKTNDTTVEKLGELLRENPTGLLVLRDELVGLIATWDKEGREGERAFFLEAWNGNQSFDTDRIGRGHISIPNLCVSIFGGIQPDKLTMYLEQAVNSLANDGMLQRFQLLVFPDACPWEWRDRAPDKVARDEAFAVFEALAALDPRAIGATPADEFAKFPCFVFDEDAQAVFIEWSTDLHRNRIPNEDDPIVAQHLAKYNKLFPALALILHIVDCVANGVGGPVGREAALRAAAWCEYLEAHSRRCYGLLKDEGFRAAQALALKLQRGAINDGFTMRDIRRNQWRHLTADEAIQAALDWLEDEDWLRGEPHGGTGPGTGRRTVRYSVNPALRTPARDEQP